MNGKEAEELLTPLVSKWTREQRRAVRDFLKNDPTHYTVAKILVSLDYADFDEDHPEK